LIRSVFTGMALVAAFRCRASRQITGYPAAARPSYIAGASDPASRPTRSKRRPVRASQVAIASGSDAIFPSFTTLRASSTIQIAVSFIDTSKPA
jgi:hypothetical protein